MKEVGTMALLTVEGVYKDGRIELTEQPAGVTESARVIVTFLPNGAAKRDAPDEERERLRREAFAQMREGIDLGGPPYPKREELYDRFDR
jgi:hypothetical protein